MAAKRTFTCDLCELEFDYQSKYRRHLNSAGHRRYSSVQLPPVEEERPVAMLTEQDEDGGDDSADDEEVVALAAV